MLLKCAGLLSYLSCLWVCVKSENGAPSIVLSVKSHWCHFSKHVYCYIIDSNGHCLHWSIFAPCLLEWHPAMHTLHFNPSCQRLLYTKMDGFSLFISGIYQNLQPKDLVNFGWYVTAYLLTKSPRPINFINPVCKHKTLLSTNKTCLEETGVSSQRSTNFTLL